VKNLPLMKYKNKNFYVVNSEEQGLTIQDRIKIIKNSTENVNSCIKTSSNFLIHSSIYYMDIIGLETLDISKIEDLY
ncbi:hypothetical protein, partial [Bacillus altitudinis]|uniref:hypothetical protein n=1 Tax=Bacillus altitudinis TaxID=293387 RepID=UPI002F9206E9